MIKSLKKFDNMTLYEMIERFEEGSANWNRLNKSIEFRKKLGLDHLTNAEYLEYCRRNRKYVRKKIKTVFGNAFAFKSGNNAGTTLYW